MGEQSVEEYGVRGVYRYIRHEINRKNMTLLNLKNMAAKVSVVENEREFWKWLESGTAKCQYADDIKRTLFDKNCKGWNLRALGDIMDRSTSVKGVTDSYLYVGQPKSFFPWHCEDYNFYSISYLHFGEKKTWYSIPQSNADEFERMFKGGDACPTYMRHNGLVADPEFLRQNKIPVYRAEQEEGQFIITFPRGYHAGFNDGFNLAEATNFATESWVPFGLSAAMCESPCEMAEKKFEIDKESYAKKYLPGIYFQ